MAEISSSSNIVPKFEYHVVVTWKGESTEDSQSLILELCQALTVPGIDVLREPVYNSSNLQSQKVRPGKRISIIVFSKDFHLSELFLQTFLTILDSTCAPEYILLPIFYDVDPLEIVEETGSSGIALYEDIERWRVALRRVLDFTGFHFRFQKEIHKPMMIKHIVDFIVDGLEKNNISSWFHRECHLMDSGVSMLPESMTFPVLTKLFLQDNCNLSEIPLSFFAFMPCLQVLDMSRTNIKHLPPSIAHLGQLKELLLRGCKLLMELPSQIQALTNLKVFDLEGTELICIPKEIEMLRKLECLVVSLNDSADEYISETMENGEIIPRNTISKLTNLKVLSIFVDQHCKWWNAEAEAIIQDLISLEKLEELNLYFPTVDLLQSFVQLSRVKCGSLSNFRFIVGCHDQVIIARVPQVLVNRFETLEKSFKYVNDRGNIERVGEVLKHASAFYLDRHWTIDRLSRFKSSEVGNLRFCLLVECNEMINVTDNRGDSEGKTGNSGEPVLGLLQHLSIYYMKIMESIFVGPLARGSLHHLQTLDIHTCPQLSTVFTFGLLSCLVNLKELIVEDCTKLESIIVSEESLGFEFGKEFLPNLEKISLLHLPGLVSISSGLCVAPRLVSMVIYNCPQLQSISLVEISSPNIIKEIKGEKEWWETLDWTSGQLDYFYHVFVPFTREGLINQLVEARNSWSTLSMSSSSTRKQDQLDTNAISTLPHHKERRGQMVAVSSDFGDQGYGGVEPRSNNSILKTSEILVTQKSKPKQGLSLNAGDVNREANVASRHYPGGPTVPTYRQTKEISSVDGSKTNVHQSTVVDRSIERSPLHPNYLPRVANKDKHIERKDLGSGVRSRRESTSAYGDENVVPEFGSWDESDPTSAEGFTQVFERVRDEKMSRSETNRAGKVSLPPKRGRLKKYLGWLFPVCGRK